MAELKQIQRGPVAYEEPLFRTEAGALLFAMNFTHGTCKKPGLATMMAGPSRPGRGLGGLDGAAQAGMIQSRLGRLTRVRQAILIARFTAQHLPCSCRQACCRGFRDNPDWQEALGVVIDYARLMGATGTISHYHLARALVSRYFGGKTSFVEVAAKCGVNRDTASKYHSRVIEVLKPEEKLARYEAEALLKEAGIVESA